MTRQGATPGLGGLTAGAAASISAGLGPLRHIVVTGSTNTDLVDEARQGDTSPCVLVADHQTAGRGRLDRVWDDRPGEALLVSLRVPTTVSDRAHDVVAAVGAGARAALAALAPVRVEVKWPNDLVVTDGPRPGKLAGVLAELVDSTQPAVVVGLGCNIEPVESQPGSTSLVACGASVDRDELLAAILRAVGDRLDEPDRVRSELRRHSATLDTRVRVEIAGRGPVTGTAIDFEPDGRLVVDGDDGTIHVVGTADVVTLRPDG